MDESAETKLIPHVKLESKAQLEMLEVPGEGITVKCYDPLIFDNWNGTTVLDIMDKVDPEGDLFKILTTTLTALSYMPEVKKIVDVRSGRVVDVSDRDWSHALKSKGRSFKDNYIKEKYDDRVARGIINADEFSFEDFKKDFKENNR